MGLHLHQRKTFDSCNQCANSMLKNTYYIHSLHGLLFVGRARSGEWIHCFNLPVTETEGAQLRLCLTAYSPQCAHIWARDQGSPRKWQNWAKSELFITPICILQWMDMNPWSQDTSVSLWTPQYGYCWIGLQGTFIWPRQSVVEVQTIHLLLCNQETTRGAWHTSWSIQCSSVTQNRYT